MRGITLVGRGLTVFGFGLLFSAGAYGQAKTNQPAAPQKPAAQQPAAPANPQNGASSAPTIPVGVTPPPGYVIGPDDVLSIVYWREKDLSADVTVRPDGKISLSLLNDVQAAGLTPPQLRDWLTEAARRYVEDPNVTIVVKEIKSRNVFITGQVASPGSYPLMGPTTVLQLIAVAGGLNEYANSKKIVILRTENGRQVTYRFNYKDLTNSKRLQQNIELKPGDTVIVP